MFQRDPITFNRLKALSMRKRMDVVRSPDIGPGLFTALTPSDLASLFPDYYKRILPDVSGFRRAVSAQSAKESAIAAGKLEERLSAVESKTASIMTPWAQRQKQASAPAQLSPEQAAAFQKIQQGAIGLNSPDAKFFSSLSTSQLASIGIYKTKDNTGAEVYRYNAPEVSREEAVGRLMTGGDGRFNWATRAATTTDINQRASQIMRWAKEFGANDAAAAALVGNVRQESGFKANSLNTNGENSFGLFQLNGDRQTGLRRWAAANGRDPSDPRSQVEYVLKHEPASLSGFSSAQMQQFLHGDATPSEKSRMWLQGWERPNDKATGGDNDRTRAGFAEQFYRIGAGTGGPMERPSGPNGQYSEEQINKMMDQLRTEKNEQRRQELATMIGSAGGAQATQDATAAITGKVTYGQVKDFSQYILHSEPGHKQCGQGARILAGHMYGHGSFLSDGLGVGGSPNAGSLSQGNNYFQRSGLFHQPKHVSDDAVKNQAYLDSLPIGTVVSATKEGGAGHVQVKIGPGQWASDFKQQHFISNGYSNFAVHMPNESGLDALRRNGVEQNVTAIAGDENKVQTAVVPAQQAGEPPEAPPVAPPATPPSYNPDSGDTEKGDPGGPAPTASVDKPAVGSDFQQQAEQLNSQAVKDIQTAPPPSPNKYTVDRAGFIAAIKETPDFKNNPLSFMASEDMIIDGFNSDPNVKSAGVKYDPAKGTMTFKNAADPQVQQIMKDLKTDRFMKPIEEAKPKPKQQTEAPKETPAPTAPMPTAEVKKPEPAKAGEPPEAPPAPPPEPAPKQVQGYSDGGSFDMKGDTLNLYKVDKQDDMVAINPQTQEPVATLKSGEGITSGDSRVDVTPQSKAADARPEPNPLNTMVQKVNSLENTMQSAIELANRPTSKIESMSADTPTNHASLIADTNRMIANQQKFSPSYDRAMNRIANMTEPSGYNQHYSYGNK